MEIVFYKLFLGDYIFFLSPIFVRTYDLIRLFDQTAHLTGGRQKLPWTFLKTVLDKALSTSLLTLNLTRQILPYNPLKASKAQILSLVQN